MKKPLEIEFKYNASEVDLGQLGEFCNQVDTHDGETPSFLHASGYDYFYARFAEDTAFCRHRVGPDSNQLTFKRKTAENNNYVRIEHNIDLAPGVSPEQIRALAREFGYGATTFSIFKNCFIYSFPQYIFVYYVCYDTSMKELGRFLEIEVSESYPWKDSDEAMDRLIQLEQKAKVIGLTPQKRIKRSLFEMFAPRD